MEDDEAANEEDLRSGMDGLGCMKGDLGLVVEPVVVVLDALGFLLCPDILETASDSELFFCCATLLRSGLELEGPGADPL